MYILVVFTLHSWQVFLWLQWQFESVCHEQHKLYHRFPLLKRLVSVDHPGHIHTEKKRNVNFDRQRDLVISWEWEHVTWSISFSCWAPRSVIRPWSPVISMTSWWNLPLNPSEGKNIWKSSELRCTYKNRHLSSLLYRLKMKEKKGLM